MRLKTILTCALLVAFLDSPAWAQEEEPLGRDRGSRQPRQQRLSSEKAEAAWKWQAKGVARELELASGETAKLVEAYVAGRKSLNKSIEERRRQPREAGEGAEGGEGDREARRGRGGGRGGFRMMNELAEEQRAAFKTTVAGFLNVNQAAKVVASLGSFNSSWDGMASAVLGFELDPDQTFAALLPIRKFITNVSEMRASGDWESMREGMSDARQQLLEELAGVLSEEQLAEFDKATSRRGRRRGQGRDRGV